VDGKRIALGEVEGCLESFPKVKAARARIVMDDFGGPMVVARVVRAEMSPRGGHHRPLRAQPGRPTRSPVRSSSARAF
jgi:acyl-coenzyme A synthetase/AMP-(fatty) acid ligase